jgi:hypothetical protein
MSENDRDEVRHIARLEEDVAHLARIALHGSRRSLEMMVHRMAYHYRDTDFGSALASVDVVPGVSLRSVPCGTCDGEGSIYDEWNGSEPCPDCDGVGDLGPVET